jgi:hypothetical protein
VTGAVGFVGLLLIVWITPCSHLPPFNHPSTFPPSWGSDPADWGGVALRSKGPIRDGGGSA